MHEITVDLMPPMLDRLQRIADENSCSVQDVILHFLNCAIKAHDTAKTPEAVQEYLASLTPSRPRPVIDRARNQAIVDKFKPADPNNPTG